MAQNRCGCSETEATSGGSLYTQDVDGLAGRFPGEIIERNGPSVKPWGMYEFSRSDP